MGFHPCKHWYFTKKKVGEDTIKLVYRRPFGPDETATRHLTITLAAQATEIDLSNSKPEAIDIKPPSSNSASTPHPIDEIASATTLPTSLDWRTSGIVPAIRNQGSCGSCWAFATVGVMESAIAKAGGPLTDLSEQFLVSCNNDGWSCAGGGIAHKYHYDSLGNNQTSVGAVLEADDPYTATNGSCTVVYNHPYKLSDWQYVDGNDFDLPTVDQIKNAIYTYGPVAVGICVGSAFDGYMGGIFPTDESASCGQNKFNFMAILDGWDDSGGYWILRNSWGLAWGESGYMRIAYNTSNVGYSASWVTWNLNTIYLPLIMK
jgi:C1A family cysteine protease